MKAAGILCLAVVLTGCGAAVGDSTDERAALQMEINEALTISHLKSLVGAEIQAQSLRIIDADEDQIGEYAFILELAGQKRVRGPGAGLKFPFLGGDFRELSESGFVEVHGYLYRDFLPAEGGGVVTGDESISVAADEAETWWACYAWPIKYGATGRRSFYVTSEGTIYAADVPELSGRDIPDVGTALVDGEALARPVRPEWKRVK